MLRQPVIQVNEGESVLGRMLHAVDDDKLHDASAGLELEAKLFL
jgi:hypothetical protein